MNGLFKSMQTGGKKLFQFTHRGKASELTVLVEVREAL